MGFYEYKINNNLSSLISNNSHPNIFKIQKKKVKKIIDIDQIREMIQFTNQTSFNNDKRFVIIEDINFSPGETKAIKLGIACEPKDGKSYYLMPRSSISKTPLRMSNSIGLIDGGYRGEIMAYCDNIKNYNFSLKKGQRLFQLVAHDCSQISFQLEENLTDTSRGNKGFGSTGK